MERKIKLLGVEICVQTIDDEVHTPTGSPRSVMLHDDQEKHVQESHVAAAIDVVSATDDAVIRRSRPSCDGVSTKSHVKERVALEECRGVNIINNGNVVCANNNPMMQQPLMTSVFPPIVFHASKSGGPCGAINNGTEIRSRNTTDHQSGSNYDDVSRKSPTKKRLFDEIIHDPLVQSSSNSDDGILLENGHIYYPMPLTSIPPVDLSHVRFSSPQFELSATSSNHHKVSSPNFPVSTTATAANNTGKNKKKAKLSSYKINSLESMKRKRREPIINNIRAAELPLMPILPLENIPGLIQIIESQNGSQPVFLYRKELEKTDVGSHHNRLFVNRSDKLIDFLTKEEEKAVTKEGEGVEITGIDKKGDLFELRLMRWPSLKKIVINKGWSKITSANNAQRGDFVEIWGYRVNNNELRLVLNFRKSEIHRHFEVGSSSKSSSEVGSSSSSEVSSSSKSSSDTGGMSPSP